LRYKVKAFTISASLFITKTSSITGWKEDINMKVMAQKSIQALAIFLFTLSTLFLTSCQKGQPLPQPGNKGALKVIGSGEGTFRADLDHDGDIDGSYFAMGVSIFEDGTAKGYFECIMIGETDFLGLPVMEVAGPVYKGFDNANGHVTFSGIGKVNLGEGNIYKDVPFIVTVTQGGPGVGTLTLTVIGLFDGVPGDTKTGNGNYDLPPETVASGQITFN
jgi:hypothetical protein